MEIATSALALLEASFLTREWGLCVSMPFAGFTPLSVFSLVTCQLHCKAKHPWGDTVYKISPTRGTFLSSKSWQVHKLQHHWELLIYICRLHWGKLHWMGRGDMLSLNSYMIQSYLPAFPEHLYDRTNLQRQWDLNMGWFASCAWTTNPVSQPNTYTAIMLSQKEVMHISHYTQYCWSVSLNISKRKAILNSSALFSFPFLKN